jgi:uncharacterized membrane protein
MLDKLQQQSPSALLSFGMSDAELADSTVPVDDKRKKLERQLQEVKQLIQAKDLVCQSLHKLMPMQEKDQSLWAQTNAKHTEAQSAVAHYRDEAAKISRQLESLNATTCATAAPTTATVVASTPPANRAHSAPVSEHPTLSSVHSNLTIGTCQVLFPWVPQAAGEIHATKGEILNVIQHDPLSEWVYVACAADGREGFIGKNYIRILPL